MFTAWILLMLNSLFFTLRLSGGGSGSFPRPLKAEEERMYLERMAQGDLEARNILIEHNLRLVAHIMKKYYTPNGDQDDLISIGTIGLIKGISTFKPDKNVRLATYASRCIENEILMHFRAQRKLQGEVSLSDSIDGDGDGNSLSLMDTISVDDNMLEELDARDSCAKVRRCVKRCLDEREAMIITLRYGLNARPPLTQREIAAQCGVARNTFYYHYRDIPTLLQQIMEEVMDELVRRYYSPKSPVDCIRALLDYMKAHQKALLHIYRYLPREDFQAYLDRGAQRLTEGYFDNAAQGLDVPQEDIEIMAHFYKCAVVGALLDWLDAGMDYDIKRIFFRVCVLLNGSGKRALLRARRMQAPEPTEGE